MDMLNERSPRGWPAVIVAMFAVMFFVLLGKVEQAASQPASSGVKSANDSTDDVAEDLRGWMNRQPANAPAVTGSVLPRKRYPGGADEDDLQVQATLPNPNRGLEAQEAPPAPSEASAATD